LKLSPLERSRRKILDFDIETLAAGYADPDWVPHFVTAWAYCWIGTDEVVCRCLPVRALFDTKTRASFLKPLLKAMEEADVWTGHNLRRFDIPVLVAEAMKLDLPVPTATLVQDTMRVPRGKGFKKGQDNLGTLLKAPLRKRSLNYQEWMEAYAERSLDTVKERVVGDVLQHMQIREKMMARGWLAHPRMWTPGV